MSTEKYTKAAGASVIKNTGSIALFSLLTAVTGLLVDVLLARQFGLGRFTDAFYAAYTVPFFVATIALSLGYSTLIPVFSRYVVGRGREDLSSFLSTYLNIAGLAGVVVAVAGVVFSGTVVSVVAPGLDPETSGIAAELSRILFILVAFSLMAEVLRSFLYAMNAFVLASSSNFIRNSVVVVFLVLFYDELGIKSAAYGYSAGYMLQFLALGLRVFTRYRLSYVSRIARDVWGLKECARIGAAQLSGFSLLQAITFAERIIGSYLPAGSITALSYASRIAYMAVEFLSGSIATATLPRLSQAVGMGDADETNKVLKTTFRSVLVIFLPLTVAVLLLSKPMITVLFKRGAFTSEAVEVTALVFMFYSLSFVFQGFNRIIHNYLFAAMKPRGSLVLFTVISVTTVVLDVVLVGPLGIAALPVGYVIGSGAAFAVGYRFYVKGLGMFGEGELAGLVRKTAALSVMFGGCFYVVYRLVESVSLVGGSWNQLLSLVAAALPAGAMAFVAGRFMGLEEADMVRSIIMRRFAR